MAAIAVGALGAAATVGFHGLIDGIEWLFTGRTGSLVEAARALSPWHRALVVASGALLAGVVLDLGRRWTREAEHVDYIDAARAGNPQLNNRTTLIRATSSLLSVGSGASIGREGPMVQLAAWLATLLARVVPLEPGQRNAMLVCGIAAGVGSAYHAPIAGVVFVLELALGFFARHTVAPVLIAAATASALIYWLVEPRALYVMPPIALPAVGLGIALVAGALFGLCGWALLHLLALARRGFLHIKSLWRRVFVGGALVGAISAWVPEVWGNGYNVVSELLASGGSWKLIAFLLVCKVMATTITAGSGAIGGVFTPTLFVGATSGLLLGELASLVLGPAVVGDARALAVVGMAAVLAAVTHAPLMAIVMVLEMTGQFQLTLPLMLASAIAYAVSTQFGLHPLYGNPIEAHSSGATDPARSRTAPERSSL